MIKIVTGQPLNIGIRSYQPVLDKPKVAEINKQTDKSVSFSDVLDGFLADSKVKFSGHAKNRIGQRDIKLDDQKIKRLNDGVSRAKQKGAKDALIMIDDLAMVVSVKNNTVVTLMSGDNLKDNVFTNIDSAVIA